MISYTTEDFGLMRVGYAGITDIVCKSGGGSAHTKFQQGVRVVGGLVRIVSSLIPCF